MMKNDKLTVWLLGVLAKVGISWCCCCCWWCWLSSCCSGATEGWPSEYLRFRRQPSCGSGIPRKTPTWMPSKLLVPLEETWLLLSRRKRTRFPLRFGAQASRHGVGVHVSRRQLANITPLSTYIYIRTYAHIRDDDVLPPPLPPTTTTNYPHEKIHFSSFRRQVSITGTSNVSPPPPCELHVSSSQRT